MNLNINKNIGEITDFVASSINKELELGRNVLWFVSGGSSIPVEVEISKKIKEFPQGKLVVTLADERYGLVSHHDSNWFQLEELGFNILGAKCIPILSGKDILSTTEDMRIFLKEELEKADYKIGVFGIGADGHTAGILPHSEALIGDELASYYEAGLYNRITITPRVISMLDEAILYAIGESKWQAIEKLKEDLPIEDIPAQVLKKVPLLTIFTDYVSNK